MRAVPSLLALTALLAGPALAAPKASGLDGTWTNASLTRLQRPPALKSVILSEADAVAWETAPHGMDRADPVGQADSEWIEGSQKLARIDGHPRAAWIVDPPDGRMPMRPELPPRIAAAQAEDARRLANPEDRGASERCLLGPAGAGAAPILNTAYNSNLQIVQTPGYVVLVTEMNHEARIVPLDASRRPSPEAHAWTGESVGHWEGRTLVVTTTGFRAEAALRAPTQLWLSPHANVVERFTRTSPNEIRYVFTIDDPDTYTRPWRAEMVLTATKGRLLEFACHEGNYSLPNILAGARAEERRRGEPKTAAR
jgi:hypothetical protein